jgi:alkylation response protein AidB-like acyl-CoA dehydrogenase
MSAATDESSAASPAAASVSRTSLFTAEHDALRGSIRDFVDRELTPHADEWETTTHPSWIYPRMGELGFLGLDKPEEYGGQGGDFASAMVLFEELTHTWSTGLMLGVSVDVSMAMPPIVEFGTEEQKRLWVTPAIAGQKVLSIAMTESHAGSDLAQTRTRAVREGGDWVINGAKTYITNGCRADVTVLLAKTDPDAGTKGFTTFLVPLDSPGVQRTQMHKLGTHASDLAELFFDDVRVPDSARLGEVGRGFHQIMWELQGERLMNGVMAVALAQRGMDKTIEFARDRPVFGGRLIDKQAVRHRLADCETKLHVAREAVYSAAWKLVNGEYPVREISMSKMFATRAAFEVLDECVQLHGGAGYMTETRIERLWRDVRVMRIGAGTDEVMREVLSREYVK